MYINISLGLYSWLLDHISVLVLWESCLIIDQRFAVQAMVEIPYILVQSTVYALITYSMINFQWTAGISN
jgi:hypothetical protein